MTAQYATGIYVWQWASPGPAELEIVDSRVVTVNSREAYGSAITLAGAGKIRARRSQFEATALASPTHGAWAVSGGEGFELSDCEAIARVPNEAGGPAFALSTSSPMLVANTKIEGFLSAAAGLLRCVGVYDKNYAPVTCP